MTSAVNRSPNIFDGHVTHTQRKEYPPYPVKLFDELGYSSVQYEEMDARYLAKIIL